MFGMGVALLNPKRLIGGISLIHTETFTTAPTSGTDYTVRNGSATITHNPTNNSMVMSGSTSQNTISWDTWGGVSGACAFEMDIRCNVDTYGHKHFGFYLNSAATGAVGYRIDGYDDYKEWVRLSGGSSTGATTLTSSGTTMVLGTTYTFRIERDAANYWTFSIDGMMQGFAILDALFPSVRHGLFMYGCEVEIFEIRAYA